MRAHRVLTDGVLLRKEVGGGGYTYHSTTSSVHRGTQPFCCTLLHNWCKLLVVDITTGPAGRPER